MKYNKIEIDIADLIDIDKLAERFKLDYHTSCAVKFILLAGLDTDAEIKKKQIESAVWNLIRYIENAEKEKINE
mgnify:CR=1 FL=1